jgi:hypothetical protein
MPLGQNMLLCSRRYHSSLDSLFFSPFNIVNNYVNSAVDENQLRVCSFLSSLSVFYGHVGSIAIIALAVSLNFFGYRSFW